MHIERMQMENMEDCTFDEVPMSRWFRRVDSVSSNNAFFLRLSTGETMWVNTEVGTVGLIDERSSDWRDKRLQYRLMPEGFGIKIVNMGE